MKPPLPLITVVLLTLCLIAVTVSPVSATGNNPSVALPPDGIPRPLAPNSSLWFQFQYGGDRTTIEIRLIDGGAPDIVLSVFTPEQMDLYQRGEYVKPIGQMARAAGSPAVELHWAGKFPTSGTYYVSVANPSELAHTIRLVALGTAVQFAHTTHVQTEVSGESKPAEANTTGSPAPSIAPLAAPLPSSLVASYVPVDLPDYVGIPGFGIPVTGRPARCTPASAMPSNVTHSILLCPDQSYAPFRVTGSNLTVFGDPNALIQAPPRGFGITVTGNNVTIVGVRVAATTHPADDGKWLCIFEACTYDTQYQRETVRGGIGYGGGILLQNNSNAAVVGSAVWGGPIGVASYRSTNNKIVGNNLSNLNGWGALLVFSERSFVVSNILNDVNRPCVGPDGFYYQSGCESAGVSCVGCQHSVIVSNHCERASNCYYATGDGGLPSNFNKYYNNYCAGATNNCFEITFSTGNEFDHNIATGDENTGQGCTYPFWIAGSIVRFGKNNTWACSQSIQRAINESENATSQPTEVQGL